MKVGATAVAAAKLFVAIAVAWTKLRSVNMKFKREVESFAQP